jgi:hypothetical protein
MFLNHLNFFYQIFSSEPERQYMQDTFLFLVYKIVIMMKYLLTF